MTKVWLMHEVFNDENNLSLCFLPLCQLISLVCPSIGWSEGNHGVAHDRWIQISASNTWKKKSLCLNNNTTSSNHCSSKWYLSQRRMSTVYGKETLAFYNNSTEHSLTVMWSSIHNTSEFKLQISVCSQISISDY